VDQEADRFAAVPLAPVRLVADTDAEFAGLGGGVEARQPADADELTADVDREGRVVPPPLRHLPVEVGLEPFERLRHRRRSSPPPASSISRSLLNSHNRARSSRVSARKSTRSPCSIATLRPLESTAENLDIFAQP